MLRIGVTTTHARTPYPDFEAFLADAKLPYFVRGNRSLEKIMVQEKLDAVIVWKEHGPALYAADAMQQPFFYHPSMAKNRLGAWRKKKQPDSLGRAAGLREGDAVLDCTLGMGADSLVAAYFAGETGKVTGLEFSECIALIVRWGMRMYARDTEYEWMKPALNRVEVVHADYNTYLQSLPDRSYDVVYFDPMFRKPVYESQAISVIRQLANPEPLSEAAVREACRVARRCVILKEKQASGEFERLGFSVVQESHTSKIAYGRIEVEV